MSKPLMVRPRIGHGVLIAADAFRGKKFDNAGAVMPWKALKVERPNGIDATAKFSGPATNGLDDWNEHSDDDRTRLAKLRKADDDEQKKWRTMRAETTDDLAPRLVLPNGKRRTLDGRMLNAPALTRLATAPRAGTFYPSLPSTEKETTRERHFATGHRPTLNERLARFIVR